MKAVNDRSRVIDALEMACLQRRPEFGETIFHSDRGCQYASRDYAAAMKANGLIASMSSRAEYLDNAVTETLFGSLKVERFITTRAAKDAVMNWILWYNRKRMHSTLGYQSPVEYEQA